MTLDLTTFTEVDSASDLTVTTDKVEFDSVRRDAVSYVYKDYGAGYFGDFDIEFEFEITSTAPGGSRASVCLFALSNTIGSISTCQAADDLICVYAYSGVGSMTIGLLDDNIGNSDTYVPGGTSTPHLYCTVTRSATTLTCIIYDDAPRTSVVDTLSVTCETGTKRYLYAFMSLEVSGDTNDADNITGYTQNFNLDTEVIIIPDPNNPAGAISFAAGVVFGHGFFGHMNLPPLSPEPVVPIMYFLDEGVGTLWVTPYVGISTITAHQSREITSPVYLGGGTVSGMAVDTTSPSGNLFFKNSQRTIYKMVGVSDTIDSSIGYPPPYDVYALPNNYYISDFVYVNKGDVSDKIWYFMAAGNWSPAYLGYRGWCVEVDPMTTNITMDLSLEFSWGNAIYTSPYFLGYDENENWIVGLVNAWNSVGGYRSRIVRWDKATGNTIGTITSTPSPYNYGSRGWIDSDNQWIYIYANQNNTLYWYDYTQVTTTGALGAVGSLPGFLDDQEGIYGVTYFAAPAEVVEPVSNPATIPIDIDAGEIDAVLSNFPLTIILNNSNAPELFTEMSDGSLEGINAAYKMMVMESDGTEIPVEVDFFDVANTFAVLHVLVTNIDDTVDTSLWLYYNNQMADNTTYIGAVGTAVGQSVWDSNYSGVYHCSHDPNGDAAGSILDSTDNGNDGDPYGSMTTADLIDWPTGKAIEFDGGDDYIDFPSANLLPDAADYTWELHIKYDSADALRSFSAGAAAVHTSSWGLYTDIGVDGIVIGGDASLNKTDLPQDYVCSSGTRTGSLFNAYENGVVDAVSVTNAGAVRGGSGGFLPKSILGALWYSPTPVSWFVGSIGEFRTSLIARTAPWLKATAACLNDTLLTIGDPIDFEDLTTYTEVDSASDYTVTTSKVAVDTCRRDAVSYVYYDFGVDYFGDFDIDFEFKVDATTALCQNGMIGLSNTIGTLNDHFAADDGLFCDTYGNDSNLLIRIWDDSSGNTDTYTDGGTSCNLMYCSFYRVGTTLTQVMYSDSSRETVVDTLSITCETGSKRYLYAAGSRDHTYQVADYMTGYTQNIKIVTAG